MINTDNTTSTVTIVARHVDGSIQHYVFESDGGVFLGRSANCGLRLQGDNLSEIHCRIEREDGDAWVQDWMSKQGTMVDGVMIETKTLLEPGAVLNIGNYAITIRGEDSAENVTPDMASVISNELASESPEPETMSHFAETPALAIAEDIFADQPASEEPPIAFDFEAEFFEEETFDRETVELLRAEIVDLQTALALRDAQDESTPPSPTPSDDAAQLDQSDAMLSRMQELLDEAQRSDERVELLEEMLHASELASRSEHEERHQLEGWVGEIERRIAQREDEHAAEIAAMQDRLNEALAQRDQLQKKLQFAASHGAAPQQYEETLELLQKQNRELQMQLDNAAKENALLMKKLGNAQVQQSDALREERAAIAQERAKISRLRFELSNRLNGLEGLPKSENEADRETALRLQTLRQHLREIHDEEKRETQQASLATRVKKLWNRVEY